VDDKLVSDAAAARILSGETAGMGVGLESALSQHEQDEGVQKEHDT